MYRGTLGLQQLESIITYKLYIKNNRKLPILYTYVCFLLIPKLEMLLQEFLRAREFRIREN